MAKKNRRKSKAAEQGIAVDPPLPDRRALEQVLRQVRAGFLEEAQAVTPLDRAQELMYQAFEAAGTEQVRLARQALKISPDCADAYVLLAEHATSLNEAMEFYQQGVSAGERAIGQDAFQKAAGHFWGILETRPYMRAREGLAQCLWESGRREEAAAHFQEMLRLNPDDNQGLRWSLATLLLDMNRDAEVERLLKFYEEDSSTFWAYTRVLVAFRHHGDVPQTHQLLRHATKTNKHVFAYLLGEKQLPGELPPYMTVGGDDEAASYATGNRRVWLDTPGAITWLRKSLHAPLPAPKKPRRPSWSELRLALRQCPQEQDEVWQVDTVPLPADSPEGPEVETSWSALVVNRESRELQGVSVFEGPPRASEVWQFITEIISKPQRGDPHRPAAIEVRQESLFSVCKPKLKQIGVECWLAEELEGIDGLLEKLPRMPTGVGLNASPQDLLELPLEPGAVWQADVRPLPTWITGEGEPYRPWLGIVVTRTDDLVLAHDITRERPPADWLWPHIAQGVLQPLMGDPHRPRLIEVATEEQRQALLPYLKQCGIECAVVGELENIDAALQSMAEHFGKQHGSLSLLDVPGIKLTQLGSFYAAAAEFYRHRPWQRVRGDAPIKVECDKFHSGPWYAVVMGQLGVEQGVALYEDLAMLRKIISGDHPDNENAQGMSSLSLLYGEAFDIDTRELDTAVQHNWPVAGPEAYPQVLRVNPGMALRTPLAWELELLEGCLRMIPDFLAANGAIPKNKVAESPGNPALRLSWLADE